MLACDENVMNPAIWLCLQWHFYSTNLINVVRRECGSYWLTTYRMTSPVRGLRRPPVLHSLGLHARTGQPHGSWGVVRSSELYLFPAGACCPVALLEVMLSSSPASRTWSHFPLPHPFGSSLTVWAAVAAAVRMWSSPSSALYPSASIGEDEMFFPISAVPFPPSEHHPLLYLPHRR